MGTESIKTTGVYDREAASLAASYESKAFEEVHSDVLDLVPESVGLVLDIGAGSGRDAAWFAAHKHEVIAVEPAYGMREIAKSLHPDSRIRWLDDQLPALTNVFRTGLTFDLIWLSAVWMHVPPTSRERAFRKMVTLLRPGGRIVMSLRKGPPPEDRQMYPTHVEEIEKLARGHGLTITRVARADDRLGRKDVTWRTICLQAPDDGLGALPLLRHIIINDSKSSTYKLALLRVLVRIADSATGLVEDVDDETIAIPLGLAALYWIRVFKPLVEKIFRRSHQATERPDRDSLSMDSENFVVFRPTAYGSAPVSLDPKAKHFSQPSGMHETPSPTCRLTTLLTRARSTKSSSHRQREHHGSAILPWTDLFFAPSVACWCRGTFGRQWAATRHGSNRLFSTNGQG
jgi:SAM-dependent methyltransferase